MFYLTSIIISILIVILYELLNGNRGEIHKNNDHPTYIYNKKSIITKTERKFYDMFKNILGDKYLIIPQVNLNSIIDKKERFRNELFRNIDFGIFNKDTLELILLIEINDETHNTDYRRKKRDKSVDGICNAAGYKLIKFWTNKPNEYSYVKARLNEFINVESNESKNNDVIVID